MNIQFSLTVFLLCLFTSFLSANVLTPETNATTGFQPAGKCVPRGNGTEITTWFEETLVENFSMAIPYSDFVAIEQAWSEQQANYPGKELVGFCFIPIVEKQTPSDEANGYYKFYTKGLRVVAIIWESAPQNDVKAISVFGFENMAEAFLMQASGVVDVASEGLNEHFNDYLFTPENTSEFSLAGVKMAIDTREFDLVYLDKATLDEYATSSKFYNGNRPTVDNITEGIFIERAFKTLNVEECTNQNTNSSISNHENYRTLVVRPFPIPTLETDYDSEAALAYTVRPSCPPYWRRCPLSDQINFECALGGMVTESPDALQKKEGTQAPDNEDTEEQSDGVLEGLLLIFLIISLLINIMFARKRIDAV